MKIEEFRFVVPGEEGENLNQIVQVEEKINVEMNNIIQEIKRDNDDPMGFLGDKFTELMYSGSLYSRRILGIESSVGAFTRKHFLDFADRFFNSNNFTFFVVGNVAESEVIISFNEYFFRHCGEKKQQPANQHAGLADSNNCFSERDRTSPSDDWFSANCNGRERYTGVETFLIYD